MTTALEDIRITGVVGFDHTTHRKKFIGRNAKKDVHGTQATEPVIRIFTDRELDGVGFGGATPGQAHEIIGRSLAEIWDSMAGAQSALGRADHALHDLVGKALGRPAWSLLGGEGPAWVPVYDTTLYFSDLMPEHAQQGIGRLLQEFEEGLTEGFTAFKVKVGRGARWMDSESGLARDVEVVRQLARAAPPGVKLMADANDQFGLETAVRFLGEVGEHLWFLEEPFRESVEQGRALRAWIATNGLKTLLADGESQHDPEALLALARAGGADVLQPDIRALGLSLQWQLAKDVSSLPGVHLAPHCWGSYLGTFKMLQLARGIDCVMTCEIDRTTSDLFDDSNWVLTNGCMYVPDEPGCGLVLREDVFRRKYLPGAWRVGTI
jgi:L-alanine-DL-glutamate epimerase-like enolase superfamily enzyme